MLSGDLSLGGASRLECVLTCSHLCFVQCLGLSGFLAHSFVGFAFPRIMTGTSDTRDASAALVTDGSGLVMSQGPKHNKKTNTKSQRFQTKGRSQCVHASPKRSYFCRMPDGKNHTRQDMNTETLRNSDRDVSKCLSPMNGVTCATCTTRWPMARERLRT